MGRALRLVALATALLCFSGIGTPVAAVQRASSTGAGYHLNLYRPGVFVTQYRWTWCVGASTQAMLNIIRGTTNTTYDRQHRLVKYAMNHDGFLHSNTGGSDATGFAAALTRFGGGQYAAALADTYRHAVRRAARHIRATGRPVGLLVMGGRHAWVMTGFDATADPATTRSFEVTHIYVLGPLYPKEQKGYFDLAPNTRLTFRQFRTPFRRFDDPDSPQFDGYFVTVVPQ